MYSVNGGLCGNGPDLGSQATRPGMIYEGQVLTLQVDMDAGNLKFWMDGRLHDPGYTSGVTGSLRWATTVLLCAP